MNLLEHHVVEVLSAPTPAATKYWTVKARVNCYGRESVELIYADSYEEALKIEEGYTYHA